MMKNNFNTLPISIARQFIKFIIQIGTHNCTRKYEETAIPATTELSSSKASMTLLNILF
jgi:hypothetical protein